MKRIYVLLAVGLVIIVGAIVINRKDKTKTPYVIKDNQTSFICESIGKSDGTDDFRTENIKRSDLKTAYEQWKQSSLSGDGFCNDIDKVIIE